MSLKDVCRTCLRSDRIMGSLVVAIVPLFDPQSNFVVDLWKIFNEMLISYEDNFPDKICIECLDEIQQAYSFIQKCERTADILKKMKNNEMYLKTLKTEFDSSEYKNTENENVEWNNREDSDRRQFETVIQANVDSQMDPRSSTSIVQPEDNNLRNELADDLPCDVRNDELTATQEIKQEPELHITTDEFEEIESENESNIEIFKCPACRYKCRAMESLEDHIIDNHMIGKMCQLCNEEFKCNAIEHYSIHHYMILKFTNEKQLHCRICSKVFESKSNLNQHLKIHTDERPFTCEICPQTFRRKGHLTRHLTSHTGERPFKCQICSKSFGQKHNLTGHLRSHTGERPFKCDNCPKTFRLRNILTAHLKCHTGERPFKCQNCSKAFTNKRNLLMHLKHHTEKRVLDRVICGTGVTKDTVSVSADSKQITENDKSQEIECENKSSITSCKCPVCKFECTTIKSLKVHISENHMDEQLCKLCNKKFECTAIEHYSTHLCVNNTESILKSKHFKCLLCSKIFGSKSNLNQHLQVHTGERPFRCEICSRTFQRKNILSYHLKCHREPEFKCGFCMKIFDRKINLMEHLRLHTREKSNVTI